MKRNPKPKLGFVPQPNLQNSRFFGLALAQCAVGIGIVKKPGFSVSVYPDKTFSGNL